MAERPRRAVVVRRRDREVSNAERDRVRAQRFDVRSGVMRNRATGATYGWSGRVPGVTGPLFGYDVPEGERSNAEPQQALIDPEIERTNSAIEGYFNQYIVRNVFGPVDEVSFLRLCAPSVARVLTFHQDGVKVIFKLSVTMQKYDEDPILILLSSYPEVYQLGLDINQIYRMAVTRILDNLDKFHLKGSGFRLVSVNYLRMNTAVYHSVLGASSFFRAPDWIVGKRATINVRNNDDRCFMWSIGRALNPVNGNQNGDRPSNKLWAECEKLDWSMFDDTDFPMIPNNPKIEEFEDANGIRVHILAPKRVNEFIKLRPSYKRYDRRAILLYLSNEERRHYITVTQLNRLMGAKGHKEFFCEFCLGSCASKGRLDKHMASCRLNEEVTLKYPNKGDKLEFVNHHKRQRHPLVVYADFEAFPVKIHEESGETVRYEKHKACSFCIYIVSDHIRVEPYVYSIKHEDEDVSEVFVKVLKRKIKDANTQLKYQMWQGLAKCLTKEQGERREAETRCCVCEELFTEDSPKTNYHDMTTGDYIGVGHWRCIRASKIPNFTPVIIHNFSGYDNHLIIKQLSDGDGDITCIPTNEEKYVSVTKKIPMSYVDKEGKEKTYYHDIRFIDSYRFLQDKLDTLVGNLTEEQRVHQRRILTDEQFKLTKRKGIFMYSYNDSVEKLSERSLPPIEYFYSDLSWSGCTEDDYKHANKVFETVGSTGRDYLEFYQLVDVLQLADVFEPFRYVSHKEFGLDPAHYYTTPGLAWDAMLRKTGVRLDLISDPSMVSFFEAGIRGGVSTITHRYAEANNEYLDSYDPDREISHILHVDENNLYGWAMTKELPVRNFKWATEEQLANWRNVPGTYEVDMRYDVSLHDDHNDYPLAPERMEMGKVKKLVPNLNDKYNYVCHHRALKLYESLGLRITKVHRGVTYEEEAFMEGYIDTNTRRRALATNKSDKDSIKLFNNSVFGKTMENVRLRQNIRLVDSVEKAKKICSEVNYTDYTEFHKKLVAVHYRRSEVTMNKPLYLGQAILDISKTLMYEFHYNYAKVRWPTARLLFTDTDSLCYHITDGDPYKDIERDAITDFDTDEYVDHPVVKTKVNKKVLGVMKDEHPNDPVLGFTGLRSKVYAIKTNSEEIRKCKGTKRATVRECISYDDFKRCLFSGESKSAINRSIRSKLHVVYSISNNKIALSSDDDKRVIREDGISTYAIGHYKTLL